MTWLLHRHDVSWGYYLDHGAQQPRRATWACRTIWNPLPGFTDVQQDHQAATSRPLSSFYAQAKAGTLPQVSWIVPQPSRQRAPARAGQRRARPT